MGSQNGNAETISLWRLPSDGAEYGKCSRNRSYVGDGRNEARRIFVAVKVSDTMSGVICPPLNAAYFSGGGVLITQAGDVSNIDVPVVWVGCGWEEAAPRAE